MQAGWMEDDFEGVYETCGQGGRLGVEESACKHAGKVKTSGKAKVQIASIQEARAGRESREASPRVRVE